MDFPVVYRAFGPLDRIVQAAGRCNRNFLMEKGEVIVFRLEDERPPSGPYEKGLATARLMLDEADARNLHDPVFFNDYFRRVYGDLALDAYRVQELRKAFNYPEVARHYRLIPEETVPVVVPYEESAELLAKWTTHPSMEGWRELQPYVVSVFQWQARRYENEGLITPVSSSVYQWIGNYDSKTGLSEECFDTADLIV